MVYLDLRDIVKKIGRAAVLDKLEGILEIYEKFVGTDPLDEPMKIFPAVHYSMGGLWVDLRQRRDPDEQRPRLRRRRHEDRPPQHVHQHPGLYTPGEARSPTTGPTAWAPNSLLSCIFDGLFMGPSVKNYIESQKTSAANVPQPLFDAGVRQEEAKAAKNRRRHR